MAPRPHLQAAAIAAWLTHGPYAHGDGWQSRFTLTTVNGKKNWLRHLKDGVPQGSTLVPLLFNIYISDLPNTISRKYAYADDLAIVHADGHWQVVEEALTKDKATLSEYLQTWKLNLGTTKTVSAVFHLNTLERNVSWKSNTTMKPALLLRVRIPRSNVGQVAHV